MQIIQTDEVILQRHLRDEPLQGVDGPHARIGIAVQSFNPAHFGHRNAVLWARELRGHTHTVLATPPVLENPNKKIASKWHRLNMGKLLFADREKPIYVKQIATWNNQLYPYYDVTPLPGFQFLSDHSLRDLDYFYMWETAELVAQLYPQAAANGGLELITGSDTLTWFPAWGRTDYLLSRCRLVVVHRTGYEALRIIGDDPLLLRYYQEGKIIPLPYNEASRWEISGSVLRKAIQTGAPIAGRGTTDEVDEYVHRYGLYQE